MQYEEDLAEVGLNKWESRTYVALLELGSTTTGPIVKKSEVPPSKIYPVLESLNNKGFVNYIIKGKTKYFQAVNPDILKTISKKKEKKIEELRVGLQQLDSSSKKKQKVEIFEGMKAITSLCINLIENSNKGDEWLSFSIGEDELTEKGEMLWNKIGVARSEKKLVVRLLDNEEYKEKIKSHYEDRWKYIKEIMRFGKTFFPTTTIIFQNRIILLNLLSDPETAIVIESEDLLRFYKNFFMQQWKTATK